MARSAGTSPAPGSRGGPHAAPALRRGAHGAGSAATIGQVGNTTHGNIKLGGGPQPLARKRSSVRGSVMNPRDHPHGGGEGKSPVEVS